MTKNSVINKQQHGESKASTYMFIYQPLLICCLQKLADYYTIIARNKDVKVKNRQS